jgi:hypothetical protein
MKAQRRNIGLLLTACSALWVTAAVGQTFSSGSTGVLGAYAPTCTPTPCTVSEVMPPDGVFNYTTVTIPSGVTVRYTRNAANTPVRILATGDVTVNGTISVNGGDGAGPNAASAAPGGAGGPGGFSGGNGAVFNSLPPMPGLGPGGGPGATDGGGTGTSGTYGASASFVALTPLFGGSGGGGGMAFGPENIGRHGGGGGGGAILIASSGKISIPSSGSITANGGNTPWGPYGGTGGNGSGGAIRLVAREVVSSGSLLANGGTSAGGGSNPGRIRVEAILPISLAGTNSPYPSQSGAPGPVNAASNPALVNLPTVSIGTVGSVAPASPPSGTFSTIDATIPQGTVNPVAVTLAVTNTPVGGTTALFLKLVPQNAAATTINIPAASHTGTFASSSATTSVTFPVGQISILQAWATFTLTSTVASLFPAIDGEPVDRVMVASADQGPSTLSLVTKSGKQKRLHELQPADQLKVATAWQVLQETRSQ